MKETQIQSENPTRREFIRRAAIGASLVGVGAASGLLASGDKTPPPIPPANGKPLAKEFTYDVSALTQVDPKWIHYAETASIPSGFKELRGIASMPDDRLLAIGDQSLQCFAKSGELLKTVALGDRPRCVAVGGSAQQPVIYVGMTRHVRVLNEQGDTVSAWETLGENAVITSIAASAKDVFVADAGNRVVIRFDLSGKQLGLIGRKNPEKDILGFVVPSPYFEVGVSGNQVWAVNPAHHRIESFTFEGELITAWGTSSNAIDGFCGCCNPIHFTRMQDGRFVTSEKGLPRVKVYSAEGKLESVVAVPGMFPEQLKNPKTVKPCLSLAVNSAQQVLVADANTRAVRIFSPISTSEQKS